MIEIDHPQQSLDQHARVLGGGAPEQLFVDLGQLVLDAAELADRPLAKIEQLRGAGALGRHALELREQSGRVLELDRSEGQLGSESIAGLREAGIERCDGSLERAGVALLCTGREAQILERGEQQRLVGIVEQRGLDEAQTLVDAAEPEREQAGLAAQLAGGQVDAHRRAQLGSRCGLALSGDSQGFALLR